MFIIESLTEKDDINNLPLVWSNEWGWVSGDSDVVTFFEEKPISLPIGGKLIEI